MSDKTASAMRREFLRHNTLEGRLRTLYRTAQLEAGCEADGYTEDAEDLERAVEYMIQNLVSQYGGEK